MDILRRSASLLTPEAWEELDEQAKKVLVANLSARKFVDVEGPKGWTYSAHPTGRLEIDASNSGKSVQFGVTRCFLWWRTEQRLNSIFGNSTTLAEEPKTPTCPRLKRPRRRSPFSRNRQFTRAWLRQVLRVLRPLRKEAPFLLRARTRMESSTVFQRQCSLSGRRQSKVHTHSLHLRNSGKPYTAQHRGIRHQNTSPISSTRSSSPPRTSRTLSRCAAATLNSFSDKIFRSASRSGTAERCDFSSPSHSHSES